MAEIRTATIERQGKIMLATIHLKMARELFAEAGCPRTLMKVRAAISSAGGAERHVKNRINRSQELRP